MLSSIQDGRHGYVGYVGYVSVVLVAMGSNHHANDNLADARAMLTQLGRAVFTHLLVNPDYTATPSNPKPDYTNQCAIITLNTPISLCAFHQHIKDFERRQQRHDTKHKQQGKITIDIDVLAVQLVLPDDILQKKHQAINRNVNNNNVNTANDWLFIASRLPLKEHERHGVKELLGYTDVANTENYISTFNLSQYF